MNSLSYRENNLTDILLDPKRMMFNTEDTIFLLELGKAPVLAESGSKNDVYLSVNGSSASGCVFPPL